MEQTDYKNFTMYVPYRHLYQVLQFVVSLFD